MKGIVYVIEWHTNHACGFLDGEFSSRREAEKAARAWKREMVSIENTPLTRKYARQEYGWEIISQDEE